MPRTKETFEAMRQTTRQKIETAALSIFARKGLSVKVGEIAQASGVSQGLMYSHYPSKDALIDALIRQAKAISSQAILDFSGKSAAAADKIKGISGMMCHMFMEAPIGIDYFMFMVQVGMSGFQTPKTSTHLEEHKSPTESLAQIIAQGQAEGTAVRGDPLRLSVIYWAALQGLCCHAITGTSVSPEPEMLNRILLKEGEL